MVKAHDPAGRHRRPYFCGLPGRLACMRVCVAIVAAVVTGPTIAWGQETVVIGSGLREVEINLSVLDELPVGAAASRQQLLVPGEQRPGQAIVLRAPGGARQTSPELTPPEEVAALHAEAEIRREPVKTMRDPESSKLEEFIPPQEELAPPRVEELPPPRVEELVPPPIDEPPPAPEAPPAPAEEPTPALVEEVPPLVEEVPPTAETPVEPPRIEPIEPEPGAAEETVEMAALPAIRLPVGGGQVLRIEFSDSSTRVPAQARESLRTLAAAVNQADGRLQLKAFAGGSAETASGERRTSLSRALAVRSFLIEEGVRSTRIDVRALGSADDDGPAERVDVLYLAK